MVSKLKLEDCATKVYSISSATNYHGFSRNLEAQEEPKCFYKSVIE
jgi:hypothetical protein